MRERGLKFLSKLPALTQRTSLPMRERGLKYRPAKTALLQSRRSPCGSVD